MARRREIFRIEEIEGARVPAATHARTARVSETGLRPADVMAELRALRETIAAQVTTQMASSFSAANPSFNPEIGSIQEAIRRTKQEVATLLLTSYTDPEMGRVSQELNAVIGGTETATHRILQASEEIEEAAKTLAAALKNIQDQALARDILDQVTTIFEACHFQDLAGQRINKVIATLTFIEEHILRLMEIWGGMEEFAEVKPAAEAERAKRPALVNGPCLETDEDCVNQREIDAMFSARC
jgi:chemotaxis protein CheZ